MRQHDSSSAECRDHQRERWCVEKPYPSTQAFALQSRSPRTCSSDCSNPQVADARQNALSALSRLHSSVLIQATAQGCNENHCTSRTGARTRLCTSLTASINDPPVLMLSIL